jgi:hypothetical protein
MDEKQMEDLEHLAMARTQQLRAAVQGIESLLAALKDVQTAQTLNDAKHKAQSALTSLDKVLARSLSVNAK